MSELSPNLSAALAKIRKESLLKQARIVRDWKDGPERAEQAKTLIRQALVEWATGKISQGTESNLYTILSFAMPGDDVAANNKTTPMKILEQQAAWEIEHQKQLDRQNCTECGDGVCPTEPIPPRNSASA